MRNTNTNRMLPAILLAALAASVSWAQEPQTASDQSDGANAAAPAERAPSLSDSMPNPPRVSCSGGQLKISANNSTLGSVLTAVRACAGFQVDLPEGAAAGRIFDELGPGPTRDVLNDLLSSTGFNFVIGSSDSEPDKVETVLLMARAKDAKDAGLGIAADRAPSANRRAWLQARQNARPYDTITDDTSGATVEPLAATVAEEPAPQAESAPASANPAPASSSAPPVPDGSPSFASSPVVPPAAATADAGQPQVQPGTTEDKIANMQQLFEQRKQMVANQNTAPH
jgi:hypothetical protein